MSGFGACRTLLDVCRIHFVESFPSQSKHILGLADKHTHASTFVVVQLCCEGKINISVQLFIMSLQTRCISSREIGIKRIRKVLNVIYHHNFGTAISDAGNFTLFRELKTV